MNLENNCDHDWMSITCAGDDERKFICNGCSMTKSVPYGWEEMTWNEGDEGTDHCTDIRNHVSPNTEVLDR